MVGMEKKLENFRRFLEDEMKILGMFLSDERVLEGMGATSHNKKKYQCYQKVEMHQIGMGQGNPNNQGGPNAPGSARYFKRKGRTYDVEKFKPCPAGCGNTHHEGTLKGCKKFRIQPVEEKWDVTKKHKICKCCLKGPRDRTHKKIVNCDGPKCIHCGGDHASMMCKQKQCKRYIILLRNILTTLIMIATTRMMELRK